tara:strand:- start:4119 stop:5195 length:1077 start_codon:yes stop_codon:yes gene_type:complete
LLKTLGDNLYEIKIANQLIGKNSYPFIVGEAGINHNGEINKAFEMIEVAKKIGLNAIKFQTFKASEFCGNSSETYTYRSQGKEVTEPMIDMFSRCEFSNDEWIKIYEKCQKEKIHFMSTPQNYSDLELLLELGIDAIKVGSDDLTNLPLLKKFSNTKLPIILSSGMSTLEEVSAALDTVGFHDGYPTILLVTTSQYPTPPEDVNLLKFHTLSRHFPELILGFSDHTIDSTASSIACGFGARFFEKHFTLDRDLPGPDHWFSINPSELEIWKNSVFKSFKMLGNENIRPTKIEEKMKNIARRSIVILKDIEKGELLTNENLGLKRPGYGLPPKLIDKILGKYSTKKILKGQLLKEDDYK